MKMTNEKPLEILVVEDHEENRKAADAAFKELGVKVDYAVNYNEAIEMLENKIYAAAIVDLNFPRKAGAEPEKIGIELGKELDVLKGKYRVPHVFLSGGYFHGNTPQSRIFIDEFIMAKKDHGESTSDKSNPQAWTEAYERILKFCPEDSLKEIVAAKERCLKYTGKIYKQE